MAEVGETAEGTVAKIMPYGAFVDLDDGTKGLVHISQVDRSYVQNVTDFIREGEKVTVKVVGVKDDGRLDLSIKALQEPDPTEHRPTPKQDPDFERMLKKFMQRSNERQADIKRNVRNKLG
jgi:S1 RNA binding domain protein